MQRVVPQIWPGNERGNKIAEGGRDPRRAPGRPVLEMSAPARGGHQEVEIALGRF